MSNTQWTGWIIQPKSGTDKWLILEIPGGYRPGQPLPGNLTVHEFDTKDEALASLQKAPTQR